MHFPFQNQCSNRTQKYGILDAISYMAGTSAGAKVTLQSTQLTSQSSQHMVEWDVGAHARAEASQMGHWAL